MEGEGPLREIPVPPISPTDAAVSAAGLVLNGGWTAWGFAWLALHGAAVHPPRVVAALQRVHLLMGSQPLIWLTFLYQLVLLPATWVNKRAISEHYTLGDDFYLTFIDSAYRFYSQVLFHRDDEMLEQAAEHKLETMYAALGLRPGMRLLYTSAIDRRLGLTDCGVKIEDFLYRVFRMFLWTGCYGFYEDTMQAYHIVAERRLDRGPRPGRWKGAAHFAGSLV